MESYKKSGNVQNKPRKGRPAKLSKENNRYIRDSLLKGKKSTKDVQLNLEKKGVKVHKRTVCRHAKAGKAGISYKPVLKKPHLTKAMKTKRL